MLDAVWMSVAAFVAGSTLVLLLAAVAFGSRDPVEARVLELRRDKRGRPAGESGQPAWQSPLARAGQVLSPADTTGKQRLRSMLIQSGFYKKNAFTVYLGAKLVVMLGPFLACVAVASLGLMPMRIGLIAGAAAGIFGNLAAASWMRGKRAQRQTNLRRALPDALDVIVVCLEGGLSLPASFARVASELSTAHPMLAAEMGIVQREIQLGRSTGEALRCFADRFDLGELRSLASVVLQAERFGASVVKAMRVHADSLRLKRQQHAEEMAHKVPTKILFPTIFFIFPAMFIVLLGPAVFQIMELFRTMKR